METEESNVKPPPSATLHEETNENDKNDIKNDQTPSKEASLKKPPPPAAAAAAPSPAMEVTIAPALPTITVPPTLSQKQQQQQQGDASSMPPPPRFVEPIDPAVVVDPEARANFLLLCRERMPEPFDFTHLTHPPTIPTLPNTVTTIAQTAVQEIQQRRPRHRRMKGPLPPKILTTILPNFPIPPWEAKSKASASIQQQQQQQQASKSSAAKKRPATKKPSRSKKRVKVSTTTEQQQENDTNEKQYHHQQQQEESSRLLPEIHRFHALGMPIWPLVQDLPLVYNWYPWLSTSGSAAWNHILVRSAMRQLDGVFQEKKTTNTTTNTTLQLEDCRIPQVTAVQFCVSLQNALLSEIKKNRGGGRRRPPPPVVNNNDENRSSDHHGDDTEHVQRVQNLVHRVHRLYETTTTTNNNNTLQNTDSNDKDYRNECHLLTPDQVKTRLRQFFEMAQSLRERQLELMDVDGNDNNSGNNNNLKKKTNATETTKMSSSSSWTETVQQQMKACGKTMENYAFATDRPVV